MWDWERWEKFKGIKVKVKKNYSEEPKHKYFETEEEEHFSKPMRNPDGTIMTAKQ